MAAAPTMTHPGPVLLMNGGSALHWLRRHLLFLRPDDGAAAHRWQRFLSTSLRPVGGAAARLLPADGAAALPGLLAPKSQQNGNRAVHGQRRGSFLWHHGLLAVRKRLCVPRTAQRLSLVTSRLSRDGAVAGPSRGGAGTTWYEGPPPRQRGLLMVQGQHCIPRRAVALTRSMRGPATATGRPMSNTLASPTMLWQLCCRHGGVKACIGCAFFVLKTSKHEQNEPLI